MDLPKTLPGLTSDGSGRFIDSIPAVEYEGFKSEDLIPEARIKSEFRGPKAERPRVNRLRLNNIVAGKLRFPQS